MRVEIEENQPVVPQCVQCVLVWYKQFRLRILVECVLVRDVSPNGVRDINVDVAETNENSTCIS